MFNFCFVFVMEDLSRMSKSSFAAKSVILSFVCVHSKPQVFKSSLITPDTCICQSASILSDELIKIKLLAEVKSF